MMAFLSMLMDVAGSVFTKSAAIGLSPFDINAVRFGSASATLAAWQLCRCRGHKCISKLFPPEVADLEPVLHALYSQDHDADPATPPRCSGYTYSTFQPDGSDINLYTAFAYDSLYTVAIALDGLLRRDPAARAQVGGRAVVATGRPCVRPF